MIDKESIIYDLKFIDSMRQHGASPNVDDYWKRTIDMLTENEENTKKFLNNCSDWELYHLSEILEEVAFKFQSKHFIEFLKELNKNHPNSDMTEDIKWAEQAIQED